MKEFLASPLSSRVLYSLLTILIAYLITLFLIRFINRNVKDLKAKYNARKYAIYTTTLLTVLIIVLIWVRRGASLMTILGFLGAGLTLALHQPVTSIAGWLLLIIRKPYQPGDRVEIGGVRGDIIDIRLFFTSILEIGQWVDADQSTGRIIHVPNGKIFTEPIFNYTRGFEYLWHEIKVVVTFESNWKKAKEIMLEIGQKEGVDIGESMRQEIQRLSKKYLIHYEKLTPYVWTNIVDFGVELTLRILTEARKRRMKQDVICQAILDRFNKEPDVDFAYPTYRIYKRGE